MNEEAQLRYQGLDDKHQGDIRYNFEEMLIDTGRYSRQNISEVDDGRDEYINETYEETDRYLSDAFDRARDDALTDVIGPDETKQSRDDDSWINRD